MEKYLYVNTHEPTLYFQRLWYAPFILRFTDIYLTNPLCWIFLCLTVFSVTNCYLMKSYIHLHIFLDFEIPLTVAFRVTVFSKIKYIFCHSIQFKIPNSTVIFITKGQSLTALHSTFAISIPHMQLLSTLLLVLWSHFFSHTMYYFLCN